MAEFDFEPEPEPGQLSLDKAADRLRQIQAGLKRVAANLHVKLELLDSEPDLEQLRRESESRAADLEAEVKRLRADLKSVKDLLGSESEHKKASQP